MDSDKFEDNGFEKISSKPSPGAGYKTKTDGDADDRAPMKDTRDNKNSITLELKQQIAKQTAKFDQLQANTEKKNRDVPKTENRGAKQNPQQPLNRMGSLKIQDSLLNHVKRSGFKEGFNATGGAEEEEQKGKQSSAKAPEQNDNDLKYNSPETDPNSKR
jgi:hypothetical protein